MRLLVQGRVPLKGQYQPSGNSNEAVALLAASLLSSEEIILTRVPNTSAVRQMLEVAQDLGTTYVWEGEHIRLNTPKLALRQISSVHSSRAIGAVLYLAAILARRDHAVLEWTEPLNRLYTHLTAMRDLGLRVDIEGQMIKLAAHRWEHQEIVLMESSVTATVLVCMLAAALGQETVIYNAASEPHVRSLQHMLVKMGAQIDGIGSNLLKIRGVENLNGTSHTVQPDHIEVASVAAICGITPGHVQIQPVILSDLHMIRRVYERLGMTLMVEGESLHVYEQNGAVVSSPRNDVEVEVDTAPWPGFPSDLVAIATVLATQAKGTTLIHEKLYSNRLLFIDKLKSMGAQIVLCDPHRAVVIGPCTLRGEYMDTPDIRIGLGLLGAAMCADGQSVIDRAELFGRNFENVIGKLRGLGAEIEVQN